MVNRKNKYAAIRFTSIDSESLLFLLFPRIKVTGLDQTAGTGQSTSSLLKYIRKHLFYEISLFSGQSGGGWLRPYLSKEQLSTSSKMATTCRTVAGKSRAQKAEMCLPACTSEVTPALQFGEFKSTYTVFNQEEVSWKQYFCWFLFCWSCNNF